MTKIISSDDNKSLWRSYSIGFPGGTTHFWAERTMSMHRDAMKTWPQPWSLFPVVQLEFRAVPLLSGILFYFPQEVSLDKIISFPAVFVTWSVRQSHLALFQHCFVTRGFCRTFTVTAAAWKQPPWRSCCVPHRGPVAVAWERKQAGVFHPWVTKHQNELA